MLEGVVLFAIVSDLLVLGWATSRRFKNLHLHQGLGLSLIGGGLCGLLRTAMRFRAAGYVLQLSVPPFWALANMP